MGIIYIHLKMYIHTHILYIFLLPEQIMVYIHVCKYIVCHSEQIVSWKQYHIFPGQSTNFS